MSLNQTPSSISPDVCSTRQKKVKLPGHDELCCVWCLECNHYISRDIFDKHKIQHICDPEVHETD